MRKCCEESFTMEFERVKPKGDLYDQPTNEWTIGATISHHVDDGNRGTNTRFIFWITFLMLVYILELGIQITVIVICWRSAILSWNWFWFLTTSSVISSILVTILSFTLVCKGMDFAGRHCGRLLCYVMHALLIGLFWRYLKIIFAYDHADYREFMHLKILQTFIQSLPVTSIHLAWLIVTANTWEDTLVWLLALEIFLVTLSSTLSTILNLTEQSDQSIVLSTEDKSYTLNKTFTIPPSTTISISPHINLHTLGTKLLLCARILILGMLIYHFTTWSILPIALHLIFAFLWILLQTNGEFLHKKSPDIESQCDPPLNTSSCSNSLCEKVTFSYLIFWDILLTNPFGFQVESLTWFLPLAITQVENVTMILIHWKSEGSNSLLTIVSGSFLLLGWLFFSSSSLITSVARRRKNSLFPEEGNKSTRDSVLVSSQTEGSNNDSGVILMCQKTGSNDQMNDELLASCSDECSSSNQQCEHIKKLGVVKPNNHTNISGCGGPPILKCMKGPTSEIKKESLQSNARRGSCSSHETSSHPTPETETSHHLSQTIPKSTNPIGTTSDTLGCQSWTVDTCCNDSNGSSNSRNTNTLVEPIPILLAEPPEPNNTLENKLRPQHMKLSRRISLDEVPFQSTKREFISREFIDELDPNGNTANYFSDIGSYTTSFSGPYPIRTSTPIQIKKASTRRVITNYPKLKKSSAHPHYKKNKGNITTSNNNTRCLCQLERACPSSDEINPNTEQYHLYDKLIEDSYGILICEGDGHNSKTNKSFSCQHHPSLTSHPVSSTFPKQSKSVIQPSIFHASKKLKVLCAKCLQNHDPLLSVCGMEEIQIPVEALHHSNFNPQQQIQNPGFVKESTAGSVTTDYPSDTEATWTQHDGDEDPGEYSESNMSTATYTTWPKQVPTPSMWATLAHLTNSPNKISNEFTSLEYVKTWLLASQPRNSSSSSESNRIARVACSNVVHQSPSRFRTLGAISESPCDKIKRKVRRSKPLLVQGGEVSHRGKSDEILNNNVVMKQPPPRRKIHPVLSPVTEKMGETAGSNSSNTSSDSDRCRKKKRQRLADDNGFDDFYNDIETVV